jgi:hypothetical protein
MKRKAFSFNSQKIDGLFKIQIKTAKFLLHYLDLSYSTHLINFTHVI